MTRSVLMFALGWGLTFMSGLAPASDDARVWLDRMSQAVQNRNYVGTFVYLHDGKMESMRVVHRANGDGERERLYSLTGVAREVLRDREAVTCILPDSESVVVSASKPRNPLHSGWRQDFEQLRQYYELHLAGEERVMGRLARVVAIQPKDAYRYGHRLWLDVDSNLMLKSMVLDERGQTVEQMMFTELDLPEHISDAALEPALSGEGFTWRDDRDHAVKSSIPEQSAWRVTKLPNGFILKHHNQHHSPAGEDTVEHRVYSDGLATVSVYIEKAGAKAERFDGLSRRGAVNAFGTMQGNYQVTAVGAVPAVAVELVARSVRPQTP